jgi:hypothetical protein
MKIKIWNEDMDYVLQRDIDDLDEIAELTKAFMLYHGVENCFFTLKGNSELKGGKKLGALFG